MNNNSPQFCRDKPGLITIDNHYQLEAKFIRYSTPVIAILNKFHSIHAVDPEDLPL